MPPESRNTRNEEELHLGASETTNKKHDEAEAQAEAGESTARPRFPPEEEAVSRIPRYLAYILFLLTGQV